MMGCKVRLGIEIESGLGGVFEPTLYDILVDYGISVEKVYYDGSLYCQHDIFDKLLELYDLEEEDYIEESDGLEFVLKASLSLNKIEENLKKITNWVKKLELSEEEAFTPECGAGGHVHFSSKAIIENYDNYGEYISHNELSLKLLALYTVYSLCNKDTYERTSDYRYMGRGLYVGDTKYQFVRIVDADTCHEHIELRMMDSLYSLNKYLDYLKLLRVYIKNSIDKDFNKQVLQNIIYNSRFNNELELNNYIVYVYNSLISSAREDTISKESKTLSKLLESFVDCMSFKYRSFKNRLLEYIDKYTHE